jgi:hypothetical protein
MFFTGISLPDDVLRFISNMSFEFNAYDVIESSNAKSSSDKNIVYCPLVFLIPKIS